MDRRTVVAVLATAVLAIGFGGAVSTAVAVEGDPQPQHTAGTATCVTGSTGYCKIGFRRALRAAADTAIVTPIIGGGQAPYSLSVAAGSLKADGVNVRATRSGKPLARVRVTVSYFAQEPYLDSPTLKSRKR